jgi:hypothetical protein
MTMPPMPVPPGRGPSRRWLARAAGVAGGLLFAGFFLAYAAATLPGPIEPHTPFVWRSGSAIYLASGHLTSTTCDLDWGADHTIRVALPGHHSVGLVGARVVRPAPGPVTVLCDNTVQPSSGPLILLYPVAQWGSPVLLVASFLVVGWWEFGRRSGR